MRKILTVIVLLTIARLSFAQEHGFKYGASYNDLGIQNCAFDSTATALVINEFGETGFESGGNNVLVHRYHVRIKILTQEGTKHGSVVIPLRKNDSDAEVVTEIRASSFNMVNGSMQESKLESKNILTEKVSPSYSEKKFAIPNVNVGSVIEYSYTISSFYTYNYWPWKFQDEIPKLNSEYWANIPAYYTYHISLRGFLKLSKNESELIRNCYHMADCSRLKWGIKNIPAFKEEAHMTAPINYIASIHFELSDIQYSDGTKKKFTKEWKDATDELRRRDDFGAQLRRGKDIVSDHVAALIQGETDSLARAKRVYDFIKEWYTWNDEFGFLTDIGIRKAFEQKKGDVANINLSLIAALREAGFSANPVLISTRRHGIVTELFPVLSEFNYVIASVKINKKMYLLDATEDLYPFGLLPERCLNGKGRLIDNRESRWIEVLPSEKAKKISVASLTVGDDGKVQGTIATTFNGYEAVYRRAEILKAGSEAQYIEERIKDEKSYTIEKIEIQNALDVQKPLIITTTISYEPFDNLKAGSSLFNPFIAGKWSNPFKSKDRIYPVDYGAPREEVLVLTMKVPSTIELAEIPNRVGLVLPGNGGRFIYTVDQVDNTITVNQSILIARSYYGAEEYRYLRELYDNIVSVQQTDLVLKPRE